MKSFILRYTSSNSNGSDSTIDMEKGKLTNMIGFGKDNRRAVGSVKAGNHVVIIPEISKLKKTKIGYIHYVKSNKTGVDVWKHTHIEWESRKAEYIGEVELTDSEIESIGKCGAYPSDELASSIVSRFLETL